MSRVQRLSRFSRLTKALVISGTLAVYGLIAGAPPAHAGKVRQRLSSLRNILKSKTRSRLLPPPTGYRKYITYLADGVFPVDAPNPDVKNCEFGGGFCATDSFQTDIQKRSVRDIKKLQAEAKRFFKWRFGLDVDDPTIAYQTDFFQWRADTRNAYRTAAISSAFNPPGGYEVRDGGWAVVVTDPNGITLGGIRRRPGAARHHGAVRRIQHLHGRFPRAL